MEKNIYKQALQARLKFQYKGCISTEDLWSLSLDALDSIYKGLNADLKLKEEDSLLKTASKDTAEIKLKIEVVKDVVQTKLDAFEKEKKRRELKEQKDKILEALADKQNSQFKTMDEEALKTMLDNVDKELNISHE